jgi:rhamnosyltransferase
MKEVRVCAVVVSYNPDKDELKNNLVLLEEQVEKIFVVDNSENGPIFNNQQIIAFFNKVNWIPLNENKGIGAAQNIGIQKALNEEFDYILLMDQDSIPPQDLVKVLVEGTLEVENLGMKLGCIGPEIYNKNTSESYEAMINKGKQVKSNIIQKDSVISSGKLISAKALLEVGLMEEELFIDLVDFEWCWRAKKFGYITFISTAVRMGHLVGQKNINIFNLYKLLVPSPIRHYYQYRNSLILLNRDYVPQYWKFRTLIERLLELVAYSIFLKPRRQRLKFIFWGIRDGILSRKGKLINA